jgi:FHA domain
LAKLIVTRDGHLVGQQFLGTERFVIGRLADNQLTLNLPSVTDRHAEIVTLGNDHVLQDLGSVSGTWVNQERVERRILQNGDLILIGPCQIKYVNRKAADQPDFDRTLMISPSAQEGGGKHAAPATVAARAVKAHRAAGAIKGIGGRLAGQIVNLDRVLATVGKPGAVALIFRRPSGVFIARVEGAAKVNGEPLGDELRPLQEHDMIEVAGDKLEFILPVSA